MFGFAFFAGKLDRPLTSLELRDIQHDVGRSAFDMYMERLTRDPPNQTFLALARCYKCADSGRGGKKRSAKKDRRDGDAASLVFGIV